MSKTIWDYLEEFEDNEEVYRTIADPKAEAFMDLQCEKAYIEGNLLIKEQRPNPPYKPITILHKHIFSYFNSFF